MQLPALLSAVPHSASHALRSACPSTRPRPLGLAQVLPSCSSQRRASSTTAHTPPHVPPQTTSSLNRPPFALTLGLIKPDVYADPHTVSEVHAQLAAAGLELVRHRRVHWSPRDAAAFYAEHRGKFFYDRLSSYMTSGPFLAMALRATDSVTGGDADAITLWRSLIGPTHPVRAQVVAPHSLRGQFGLTDTRNSFHGSDSIETAVRELDFFFPKDPAVESYLATFRAAHPGLV